MLGSLKIMRFIIYSDNHFCEKCSLITKLGNKYSMRLENQIASLNWIEETAIKKDCNVVICGGDFFDKYFVTDQELTALKDINWNTLPHYFLVGNHESEENDLQYSSAKALEGSNRFVVSTPEIYHFWDKNKKECEVAFLPYIVESNRKDLSEYFEHKPLRPDVYRLLISHNDLFGVQMGPVISRTGFKPEELSKICNLCINGHLHNGQKILENVINIGNLTGKDFGENAFKYKHGAYIVDTETKVIDFIENPYAFNFYSIEINSEFDILKLKRLKQNSVVSLKCKASLVADTRKAIESLPNIVESRLMVVRDTSLIEGLETANIDDLTMDHKGKFVECCKEKIDNTPILEEELAEVLK